MSQIHTLHWQNPSGVAEPDAGWAAEPSSWPGKGHILTLAGSPLSLHCPGLVGSSLSHSWLLAQWRTLWCFVGIMSCTGSDEHQSWSKVSSKTRESGTGWEEGSNAAFFCWEGASTSNTSLHLPITAPHLCFVWTGVSDPNPIITSCSCHWHQPHQQRGGGYFCDAISSSPGVFLSQNCICIIKVHFLKIKSLSHTPGQSLCWEQLSAARVSDISSSGD